MSLKQPITQVRLTNVAVVRYRKHGKRFEIACYKNKVLSWRSGVERDLDEVLQIENVFSNVSKGVVASKDDIRAVFQTDDVREVCCTILEHGELQVSEKERQYAHDSMLRDVCNIIVDKCINPETSRPLTIGLVERALRTCHFSVVLSRSAKQQALEAIRILRTHGLPIERAQMRIGIEIPAPAARERQGELSTTVSFTERERWMPDDSYRAVVLLDPGNFRKLASLVNAYGSGTGVVEVLSLAAHGDDAADAADGGDQKAASVSPAQAVPA